MKGDAWQPGMAVAGGGIGYATCDHCGAFGLCRASRKLLYSARNEVVTRYSTTCRTCLDRWFDAFESDVARKNRRRKRALLPALYFTPAPR